MLEFLDDNIFLVFGRKVFQHIVGISMGTNCASLLADIFLYSYEAEFIQSLISTGKKKLAPQFNFTYSYIDDVLTIKEPVCQKTMQNRPHATFSNWAYIWPIAHFHNTKFSCKIFFQNIQAYSTYAVPSIFSVILAGKRQNYIILEIFKMN